MPTGTEILSLIHIYKLLIVDPAVAGHPGTHIAIEVIAIFILIIDQHFELDVYKRQHWHKATGGKR